MQLRVPVLLLLVSLAPALRADTTNIDRFAGGAYDGHAGADLIAYVAPASAFDRFRGGAFDGHAGADRLLFTADPASFDRFHGGAFDGHAGFDLIVFDASNLGARFRGGWYDGHNSAVAGPYTNPLNRDTDGNGIPDWWIAYYYHTVFGPSTNADLDGDGRSTLQEYVADTDPTDPNSVFSIKSISAGGTTVVSFISSAIRVYSLESATNLEFGGWTAVPGATNQPGTGGINSFIDASGTRRYYRLDVFVP